MTQTVQPRLARASDRDDVRAFLSRLSAATLQARFLGGVPTLVGQLAERETQRLLDTDHVRHVVLLAAARTDSVIRGIGEFVIDASGDSAEVALMVEDTFQGRGIGQALFGCLELLAQERGLAQFTGEIAYGNERVLKLLRGAGRPLRLQAEYGALHFSLGLAS